MKTQVARYSLIWTGLIVLALVRGANVSSVTASDSTMGAQAKTPPLHECKAFAPQDLGVWDDVCVIKDQDFLVVRRGQTLFSLSMSAPPQLIKLTTSSKLNETKIVSGIVSDKYLWLFFNSKDSFPFALEAHSGRIGEFVGAGLGSDTPKLSWCRLVGHADGALVEVTGERGGKLPVEFWMSLKSGKVVSLPVDFRLDYFSSDETIAVFVKFQPKPERPPLMGVDVRSGELTDIIPDRHKELCVPFDWEDNQMVKPLYARHPTTGDFDYFSGITAGGAAFPLKYSLDGGIEQYMSTAKINDSFVGFRMCQAGMPTGKPCPFYLMSLKEPAKYQLVEGDVTDFALLGNGRCVFETSGHGRDGRSSEAYLHAYGDRNTRNVIEGVDRLPELDKKFASKGSIEDLLTVRLIDSFGSGRKGALVLCLYDQRREDFDESPGARKERLDMMSWRRILILTSTGERYMTELYREGSLPDEFWLHDSGILITGSFSWESAGSARERKTHLVETKVQVP